MLKKGYYSVKQVAEELGISVSTVHREIKKKHMRSYKIGGRRVVKKSDLADYLGETNEERQEDGVVPRNVSEESIISGSSSFGLLEAPLMPIGLTVAKIVGRELKKHLQGLNDKGDLEKLGKQSKS